jgi:ClpP class serine protease
MIAHTLHRFLESLYNTPHLANQRTFESAVNYVTKRSVSGLMIPTDEAKTEIEPTFDSDAGIGVLAIHGGLTYKPVYGLCGATGVSYQSILDDASEMMEAGVKTIVMDIDSGGGQGYGAFECATELRQMADANGVKLYAYNDGCMASAAYAMGCIADEVYSNPFAETGSIGVLIALMNDSKALEQAGYSRSFVTAGASKVPFDANGDFREGFLEDLQTKVDALYGQFVDHVSTYTGLDAKTVRDTEAKMFMANDALSLGLINGIMTRSEFTTYIANQHKG